MPDVKRMASTGTGEKAERMQILMRFVYFRLKSRKKNDTLNEVRSCDSF